MRKNITDPAEAKTGAMRHCSSLLLVLLAIAVGGCGGPLLRAGLRRSGPLLRLFSVRCCCRSRSTVLHARPWLLRRGRLLRMASRPLVPPPPRRLGPRPLRFGEQVIESQYWSVTRAVSQRHLRRKSYGDRYNFSCIFDQTIAREFPLDCGD